MIHVSVIAKIYFLNLHSLKNQKISSKLPIPGIAARAWSGLSLQAVAAFGECVEIGLDAHPAKLLPAFHRIHRGTPPTPRFASRPSVYALRFSLVFS